MTVRELIKELKQMPLDIPVLCENRQIYGKIKKVRTFTIKNSTYVVIERQPVNEED